MERSFWNINNANDDVLGGESSNSTAIQVAVAFLIAVILGLYFRHYHQQSNKGSTKIPHVPSYIPWLGSTLQVFSCPTEFSRLNQIQYGNVFSATVLGNPQWIFLHTKQDTEAIMKASEKQVSMYVALFDLAGQFFPKENESDFTTQKARQLLSRRQGYGKPSTHHFVFSLKPQKLKAWIPGMRDTIVSHYFDKLLPNESNGQMDLFQFCFDLISGMTARVLLGNQILAENNKFDTIGKAWIQMIQEADIEQALEGGIRSLHTLAEVMIHGERRVFQQCRDFLLPHVEAEMELCIQTNGQAPEADDYPVLQGVVRSTYKDCNGDETIFRCAKTRILNDAILFTFAALTNSYGMAAWVLFYILRNIDGVGDRIRKELHANSPNNSNSNNENVSTTTDATWPELEATILEIGRLYSPGMVHRRVIKPGFVLPSTGDILPMDAHLIINVGLLHRDPNSYQHPTEFRPRRFMNDSELKQAGHSFLTFGAGMHPCVGKRFALLEIALFVYETLNYFDLELEESQQTTKGNDDPFTNRYVTNVPNHPRLDPKQNNSIWRPNEPVFVRYQKKKQNAKKMSAS